MKELVESILTGNNVEAQRLFESRINLIREKKLYEAKRNLAAQMDEVTDYSARYKELKSSGARKFSDVYDASGEPKLQSSRKSFQKKTPKKLAAPGTVIPRSLSIGDRYEKALSRAKDLEARGSSGKVAAVKKAYRPYRASKAVTTGVKTGVKKAAGLWSNIVRSGMSGPLE